MKVLIITSGRSGSKLVYFLIKKLIEESSVLDDLLKDAQNLHDDSLTQSFTLLNHLQEMLMDFTEWNIAHEHKGKLEGHKHKLKEMVLRLHEKENERSGAHHGH